MSDEISFNKIISAFVGILLLFLVTLLMRERIDAALTLAIYCMALAMPSITAFLFIDIQRRKLGKTSTVEVSRGLTTIVGFGSGLVAIAAIFWHFSKWASLIFAITTSIYLILLFKLASSKKNTQKQK